MASRCGWSSGTKVYESSISSSRALGNVALKRSASSTGKIRSSFAQAMSTGFLNCGSFSAARLRVPRRDVLDQIDGILQHARRSPKRGAGTSPSRSSSGIGRFVSHPKAIGSLRSGARRIVCSMSRGRPGTRATAISGYSAFGGKFSNASQLVSTSRPTRSGRSATTIWHSPPPVSFPTSVTSSRSSASTNRRTIPAALRVVSFTPSSSGTSCDPERPVRRDAAELAREQRHHLSPEIAVDEQPVHEHDRLAAPRCR